MSMFESAHAGHLAADIEIASAATLARGHKPGAPPAPGIGGRQIVDRFNNWFGNHLQQISPLIGQPYNDGIYLRSVLGNAYLALPIVAAILGASKCSRCSIWWPLPCLSLTPAAYR